MNSLVFLVFLLSTTTTLAQQDNNKDYDNFYQDYYYNNDYSNNNNNNKNYYYDYESGGGSYSNDNLYTDYAARQNEKILNNKTVGWVKLALAGIGGYWLGATITTATTTTTTRKKKKTNKHNRNRNDDDDVPKLRFPIHQKVDCKIGPNNNEWETGIVIKLWYEEPQGVWNPYQIQLDNGGVIYAPADNDRIVRISNRS